MELPPIPADLPAGLRHNHTIPLGLSVPVIAAINGACAGAGFVLATYADIRFGASTARIASSFASLGLPAEYGLGWMLPRLVGTANAAQLLYLARPMSADDALQLGWLQRVFPREQLLDSTLAYARDLARHSSPHSLRLMKRQIFQDAWGDLADAYRRSVDDMNASMTHPDFRLGVAAMREKRVSDFLDDQTRPPIQ
jgi:enoyl-CoA hydratase/carnithine racemase